MELYTLLTFAKLQTIRMRLTRSSICTKQQECYNKDPLSLMLSVADPYQAL